MNQDIMNQVLSGINQGLVSSEDIENLNKAITAGYGGAGKPTDLVYGGVIQTESLESTLKSVTFDMKNLKFWPEVSVDKAYNLFEQYNRLTAYGSDMSPYIAEGGAPQENDSTYVRDGQRIAFFGTRRKVSHQMTLVRTTVGDVVAQQAKEGTMDLLKHVEREMYWGNAHFTNQATGNQNGAISDINASTLAINGLYQQLLKGDDDSQQISGDFDGFGEGRSIIRDLAGEIIAQDDLEDIGVIILENFGNADKLHAEPLVISAFVKQFYPQFRSAPGLSSQTVGYDVNKMTTTAGTIEFKPNLFLRPRGLARSKASNDRSPINSGWTVTPTNVANPGLGSGLAAGTYRVKVTMVNDAGESAAVAGGTVTLLDGQAIQVAIGGTIPSSVKYMRFYVSAVGGAANSEKFVGNYRNNGTGNYIYNGAKIPGLGEAFVLDMSAEVMKFKQLSPLSKMNFAVVTTAIEFAIVLYGALFVYCPRFNGCFKNAGR